MNWCNQAPHSTNKKKNLLLLQRQFSHLNIPSLSKEIFSAVSLVSLQYLSPKHCPVHWCREIWDKALFIYPPLMIECTYFAVGILSHSVIVTISLFRCPGNCVIRSTRDVYQDPAVCTLWCSYTLFVLFAQRLHSKCYSYKCAVLSLLLLCYTMYFLHSSVFYIQAIFDPPSPNPGNLLTLLIPSSCIAILRFVPFFDSYDPLCCSSCWLALSLLDIIATWIIFAWLQGTVRHVRLSWLTYAFMDGDKIDNKHA